MAKNYYFENFQASGEQELIEDLVIESIKIYGIDVYYIKRNLGSKDDLLNEDDLPVYEDAYIVEMYVKNVDGFDGEGDFLSKFGLQIRDSMTLTVSIRSFNQEVATHTEQTRPFEGDLIYFPLNRKFFKIMHVEHEAIFYQLGQLQTYDLRCELFEYSGEKFTTGQDFIDDYFEEYKVTVEPDTETFSVTVGDKTDTNVFAGRGVNKTFYIGADEAPYLDMYVGSTYFFDQSDSSNANNQIQLHSSPQIGPNTSVSGQVYTGVPGANNAGLTFTPETAGDVYYIHSDPNVQFMGNKINVYVSKVDNIEEYDEVSDNKTIEDIADNILDFSEENPFGENNY